MMVWLVCCGIEGDTRSRPDCKPIVVGAAQYPQLLWGYYPIPTLVT